MPAYIVIALALLFCDASSLAAAVTCVDCTGEAVIVNGDLPAAKNEALVRAKWQAIEQAVGVEVKAQSVIQNMMLVDDVINRQVKGVVKSSTILSEEKLPETYMVKINACVEPSSAREAVGSLALNNGLAVLIPLRKPNGGGHEEANILSETIIGKLTEQGYTVVDALPTSKLEGEVIDKAIKSGSFSTVGNVMAKNMTNLLLVGKLDFTISTRKGEKIGYGISMPFTKATVRLTYRLLTRNEQGKLVILDAGSDEASGLARDPEDAVARGLQDLAEKFAPLVLEKVAKHVKGVAKKIRITVEGVSNASASFAVKDVLQHLSWVTAVEESGLGEFVVSYPENTIYLANSLEQKGLFSLVKFSPYSLQLKYRPR